MIVGPAGSASYLEASSRHRRRARTSPGSREAVRTDVAALRQRILGKARILARTNRLVHRRPTGLGGPAFEKVILDRKRASVATHLQGRICRRRRRVPAAAPRSSWSLDRRTALVCAAMSRVAAPRSAGALRSSLWWRGGKDKSSPPPSPSPPSDGLPQLPSPRWVADDWGLLSTTALDALEGNLTRVNATSRIRCYLAVAPSLPDGYALTPKEASKKLHKHWLGGSKPYDKSVLILVVAGAQRAEVAVGPKLKRKLAEKVLRRIVRKVNALLKKEGAAPSQRRAVPRGGVPHGGEAGGRSAQEGAGALRRDARDDDARHPRLRPHVPLHEERHRQDGRRRLWHRRHGRTGRRTRRHRRRARRDDGRRDGRHGRRRRDGRRPRQRDADAADAADDGGGRTRGARRRVQLRLEAARRPRRPRPPGRRPRRRSALRRARRLRDGGRRRGAARPPEPRYGVRSAPPARRRRAARLARPPRGARRPRSGLAQEFSYPPLSKSPSSHGHSASASSAFTSSSPSRGLQPAPGSFHSSTACLRYHDVYASPASSSKVPRRAGGCSESVDDGAHLGHRARGVERVAQRRVALERREEHLEEVLLRVGEVRRVRLAHVEVLERERDGRVAGAAALEKGGVFERGLGDHHAGAARRRRNAARGVGQRFHPAVGEHRDAQRSAHVGNRLPAARAGVPTLLLLCAAVDGEQRAARVLQQPRQVDRLIADQTDLARHRQAAVAVQRADEPPEQVKLLEQEGAEAAALRNLLRAAEVEVDRVAQVV